MDLQKLMSYTRRAIEDYHMIEDGDRIAVGISGGKDSLALLYALHGLQRFYPKKFELCAISIHLGFPDLDFTPIEVLCRDLGVSYTVVPTQIAEIVFQARKENNPCSLCAKMRKGALNNTAMELGCHKIAYAHHKDDLVETMLLSLLFEGRFHSFSPYTNLDRTGLSVIRPMIYVEEQEIISFQKKYSLPVQKNPCPMDGYSQREYAKNLVKQLEKDHPHVKNRLFSAVINGKLEGWPEAEPVRGRKTR